MSTFTRRVCTIEDMDRRFKSFLNDVFKFTDETYLEYALELKDIVKYLFGEQTSRCELLLGQIFQFLKVSRKIILEKPNKCSIKSAVKMANIISGRKLSATEDDRVYFETFFTLVLYHETCQNIASMLHFDIETLLTDYPTFEQLIGVDDEELIKLLLFRNWMKVAQLVIPSHHNKGRLLNVVTKICEGDSSKYITGGGQNSATERRVLIYEQEGNISKKARPQRRPKELIELERQGYNLDYNEESKPFYPELSVSQQLTSSFFPNVALPLEPMTTVNNDSNELTESSDNDDEENAMPLHTKGSMDLYNIRESYPTSMDLLSDLEKPWIEDGINMSYREQALLTTKEKNIRSNMFSHLGDSSYFPPSSHGFNRSNSHASSINTDGVQIFSRVSSCIGPTVKRSDSILLPPPATNRINHHAIISANGSNRNNSVRLPSPFTIGSKRKLDVDSEIGSSIGLTNNIGLPDNLLLANVNLTSSLGYSSVLQLSSSSSTSIQLPLSRSHSRSDNNKPNHNLKLRRCISELMNCIRNESDMTNVSLEDRSLILELGLELNSILINTNKRNS